MRVSRQSQEQREDVRINRQKRQDYMEILAAEAEAEAEGEGATDRQPANKTSEAYYVINLRVLKYMIKT